MEVPGREDPVNKVCAVCQLQGQSTIAEGFCRDCDEFLCQNCFEVHILAKPCREHVFSSTGIVNVHVQRHTEEAIRCKKHAKEYIKYFCRRHEMVACGDCVVNEHKGCDMEFIRNLSAKLRDSSEFKNYFQKLDELETQNKEIVQALKRNDEINRPRTNQAVKDIKQLRKKINEILNRAEDELLAEVNRLSKEIASVISDLQNMAGKVDLDISELRSNLDTDVYGGDSLFIRFFENKPKALDVEASIAGILKSCELKSFIFEADERMEELLQLAPKLGRIILHKTSDESTRDVTCKYAKGSTVGEHFNQQKYNVKMASAKDVIHSHLQLSFPTDPRLAGFEVGRRVQHTWRGIVTDIETEGYVHVQWDADEPGKTYRHRAGAGGVYDMELV